MAKAKKNQGSIRQRPDGTWEARISLGFDGGGKHIRKSIYAKTEKEIVQKLQQMQSDITQGTYTEPTRLTVSKWLDVWLNTYCDHMKQTTFDTYSHNIEKHIKPALGGIKLQQLTTHAIQGFYKQLSTSGRILQKGQKKKAPTGLSAKTVKNIHATLHGALQQAVLLSYIKTNPSAACTLPRVEKKQMQILQGEQIAVFIKATENHRYRALFLTMLFCGTRRGETLGITWDCVDFHNGTILINKQLQRKDSKLQLVAVKNDKPRRLEPPPTVFQLLRELKQKQAEKMLLAGQLWEKNNLVFSNDFGQPLDADGVYAAYKTFLRNNALPNIRLHDLRHTSATLMLQNGDSIKTVQEALGHSSAGFTLDVYGHVTPSMKKESAERMEAFISSVSN